jgi:hypothetical protein
MSAARGDPCVGERVRGGCGQPIWAARPAAHDLGVRYGAGRRGGRFRMETEGAHPRAAVVQEGMPGGPRISIP